MPKVTIERFKEGHKSIIGRVLIDGKLFCYSLEREWLDNKQFVSCVPVGKYKTIQHFGTEYSNVSKVMDVDNRDTILIHQGNYYWDIQGCILLGDSYRKEVIVDHKGESKKTGAVFNSVATLKKFYNKVGYVFDLEIIDLINQPKEKKKMSIIGITGLVSLVKIFAPTIINKFKKEGKELAEDAARSLIKKAEKKLGFEITSKEDAKKAKDLLSSEDLLELEKTALKTQASMFRADLKHGEKLGDTWKDELVTILTFVFFAAILAAAYYDPEKADEMVDVIKALLATPFGALFLFVGVSAIGGRSVINKIADKYLK